MTITKFRAVVENIETKNRLIVFPRSKKTSFFSDITAAEKALDARGRKLGAGWRGIIYQAGNEMPVRCIAI
jgi:hypothetical protein